MLSRSQKLNIAWFAIRGVAAIAVLFVTGG